MIGETLKIWLQVNNPELWGNYQAILELQNDLMEEIAGYVKTEMKKAIDENRFDDLPTLSVFAKETQDFLQESDGNDDSNEIREKPDYSDYAVSQKDPHSLDDSFTYKRPIGFELQGKKFEKVHTWQEMLTKVLEYLEKKDPAKLHQAAEKNLAFKGRKSRLLGLDNTNMRSYRQLGKYYFETNLSSNSIAFFIKKLLKLYAIPTDEMKIYLRADYNPLHRK